MVTGAALLLLIACVGQLEGSVTLEKSELFTCMHIRRYYIPSGGLGM